MIVPGSNLLNLALTVLGKATFEYEAYLGRDSNEIGIFEDSYADPVTVTGSAQPVQRSVYEQQGLDFQKNYHTFYLPQFIGDVARGRAGDKFTYANKTWQCISTMPWFDMDGWTESTCVEIPSPTNNYTNEQGLPLTTENGLQFYTTE